MRSAMPAARSQGGPLAAVSRMRRVVTATACVLLAAACSSTGSSTAGDRPTGKPVSGGTLTFAVDSEPVSWDAQVSPQDITGELERGVLDSLVAQDHSGTIKPWLATSWESSKDLRTFTFHLRHGVTFTDGTPFDAAAVKANFDRIADPATKSQYAAALLGPYQGTTVADPYTAVVHFSKPFAPFLQAASTTALGFYSPKAIAARAEGFAAGGPALVGSGPFVVSSYTKGQRAVLTRNPAYRWGPATAKHQGPAYLEKVVLRFLPEPSVRVGALTSGQVDAAQGLPPVNAKALADSLSVHIERRAKPGGVYNLFLNTVKPPFDDVRVRTAVQRAIAVGQDVKAVQLGQATRAWSPLSPVTPGYDASLVNRWPYDPKLAGRLLDQAGWTGRDSDGYRTKDGRRLSVEWPQLGASYVKDNRGALGQAIQADLKKVGIEVKRPTLDIGTYVTQAYSGKENIVDNDWARDEPDVLRLFFNSANDSRKGGQNASLLADPQVDAWTNQALTTLDTGARAGLYAKVQQRVLDLGAVVPLYIPETRVGVRGKVQDIGYGPSAWPSFYDAWLTGR